MKPKFFFVTTIPGSLGFFVGQYDLLSSHFEVTTISSQEEALKSFGQLHHVQVHCIPMEREISLWVDLKGLFSFIRYFRKERPSIVHGNTPKGSLLSMMAAWITRVPVRIYMCHGLRYQGFDGLKKKLLMLMERISCFCATDVICVSNGVKQVLINEKITNKEPVVIWNGSVRGINVDRFNPNNRYDTEKLLNDLGLDKNNFVLTFVGRIVKDKGINELVSAFNVLSKKYPHIRLLLIGRMEMEGNPISEESMKIIKENKSIIATGPQKDIPSFLAITNLFVFPSYREGFGLSLMEAGAMGVPSIATDIEGCNEVVVNGETGLLIQPHSSEAIVDAIEKLILDKGLYNKMKSCCHESIVSRYEQKTLWGKYKEYYLSKLK